MNNNNEYATVFATVMNNTSSSDEQHSPLSSLPSSSPALPLASPSLPKTPNPRLPSSSLLVRAKSKLNGAQNPKESNCRGGGRGGGGLAMDSGFSLIKFNLSNVIDICFALYLYNVMWLHPQKICKKLRQQGIDGPKPSFLHGNLKDMKMLAMEEERRDGGAIIHYYTPLPYFEKWRKRYGHKELLAALIPFNRARICNNKAGIINIKNK
ncbi:uncharacterized protein A4U43_C08F27290 [Asparagus officinalis]|nr:uncharacterized protein A4U43_C08F27290 [Asparagus officinalis]